MATTSPSGAPTQSAWTQIDALTNSTIVTVQNRDLTQGMGIVIAVADPASLAWNGDGAWTLQPGGAEMWGKAPGEHVWAKMETGTASPKPVVQERL